MDGDDGNDDANGWVQSVLMFVILLFAAAVVVFIIYRG